MRTAGDIEQELTAAIQRAENAEASVAAFFAHMEANNIHCTPPDLKACLDKALRNLIEPTIAALESARVELESLHQGVVADEVGIELSRLQTLIEKAKQ